MTRGPSMGLCYGKGIVHGIASTFVSRGVPELFGLPIPKCMLEIGAPC